VGIHRLRPTARFRLGASHRGARPEGGAKLLRKFCRPSELSITASAEKDYTFYEISTGSVRRDSAADVFLTELLEGAAPRRGSESENRGWMVGDVLTYPTKRLELALLIHHDVWPERNFSLRAYDTVGRGVAKLPDPEREFDRLSLDASVVRAPATAEVLRGSPVPSYSKIVEHLTTPLGWKLETASGSPAFRRIAFEIAYPLYGAQIVLVQE
jgi:hypothetical protein